MGQEGNLSWVPHRVQPGLTAGYYAVTPSCLHVPECVAALADQHPSSSVIPVVCGSVASTS